MWHIICPINVYFTTAITYWKLYSVYVELSLFEFRNTYVMQSWPYTFIRFWKNKPITTVSFFLNLVIWIRFYDSIKKVVWPEKAYSSRQYPSEPENVNYNHFIWILFTTTVNMCLDRIHSPENFWINNFHKTRELITHCAGDVKTYSGQFSVRDSRRWKFLLWTAVRQ